MNRIDHAIEFAAEAHKSQSRKGTDIPYISHPFGVAMLLQQAKCKENVIIAGILHDTIEDTDTKEDDIRSQFGEEVLRLVLSASEPDKSDTWEARKQHTVEYLKKANLDVRLLACADKLHNLRSIQRELEVIGDAVWSKFKRGYEEQKWYYTSLVEGLGYASRFPLLDTFQNEVEALFMKFELPKDLEPCRRNKKFFDAAFEMLFSGPERVAQLEAELLHMNALTVMRAVSQLIDAYRQGSTEQFDRKQEMYFYLTSRGIEFEINSEGTDILISACAALQELFRLYPHEVYHHFARNMKRGIL
jgi:hypothetical protein